MPAAIYDIQIEQGATFYFPRFQFGTLLVDAQGVPVLDPNGNQQIDIPRDFSGCKFRCQMRKAKSINSDVVFTVTSEDTNGGIIGDAQGFVTIIVPDEATDAAGKDGFWDLKCYKPDETEDRLIEGEVKVDLAVTTDATPPAP
jgi:hypothetical protein